MRTNALQIATRANTSVQNNPVGALKSLLFMALAIILLVVLVKFLKGLRKTTELISEAGPSTESTKVETITKTSYQDALKWLDQTTGATAIGKSAYKTIDNYFAAKKLSWSAVNKAADAIWSAKQPGYISETEVYNAIASMPSKAAISLLALSFNSKYSKLWNGSPLNQFLSKYLKLSEMNTLTTIIDKKPEL